MGVGAEGLLGLEGECRNLFLVGWSSARWLEYLRDSEGEGAPRGFPAEVEGLDNSGDFPKVSVGVEVVSIDGECGGGVPLALEVGGRFSHLSMEGGMGVPAGGLSQTAEGVTEGGP